MEEFFIFLRNYIIEHSKASTHSYPQYPHSSVGVYHPDTVGYPNNITTKIRPNQIDLKNASNICGITFNNEKSNFTLESECIRWANILISTNHWEERVPKLSTMLYDAVNAWATKTTNKKTNKPFYEVNLKEEDQNDIFANEAISLSCDFCQKELIYQNPFIKYFESNDNTFCPFCIRSGYHTKIRRNILIISFRSIISYYYNWNYCQKTPTIYISQIKDAINQHAEVGLRHPAFNYDPETYLWFIDFAKIGTKKKQIPIETVLKNIIEIISCFNPYQYLKGFKSNAFYSKYAEAINEFYHKRYRPEGKRLCLPTLIGCASEYKDVKEGYAIVSKKIDLKLGKDFIPSQLIPSSRR